jgi:hypothetical protein
MIELPKFAITFLDPASFLEAELGCRGHGGKIDAEETEIS